MRHLLFCRTILGVTFGTGRGGQQKEVTPNIVTFSVSMLPVVTNKVEPPPCVLSAKIVRKRIIYIYIYIYIYIHIHIIYYTMI